MSSVRRKRKTLTNVLSQMDTRLRSTELRQIKTGAGQAIEASAVSVTDNTIGTVVSDNAPSDWIRVSGGKYYSKRVTGETDRVELYLESDTGAYQDNILKVSGINSPYAVSGDFVVTAVNPAGEDRPSWMDSVPSGVTSTVVYTTGQDIPESTSVSLVSRYQVQSYSATTTEATVVFTGNHTFNVNDLVDTSDLEAPFDGIDGIFKVSSKTANSINYVFSAEIGAPITSTTPTSTSYVYAVAQKRALVGDTWIDTSTTPSTTYYWDGLRWSLSRSAATEGTQDTLAPANVANVSSTSSAYTIDGGIARARVTLSWEAPTKNSDDTDLTDLAGYEVWANYTGFSGPWTEKTGILSANTSTTLSNLNQNVTVYFKIFAIDSSLNRSEGTEYSTTTSIYALELNPPSTPILSTRNGVVTAQWNGLDNTGVNPPTTIRTIEVHASSSSAGFTPSSSTLKGTMPAGSGNYFHIVDLTYGVSWYVKFVAVDVNGNKTAGSVASTTNVGKVSNTDITAGTIEADRIKAGFMEALLVQGETIRATSSTLPNALVEFNSNYFRAVNTSNQETFRIDVANGVTTIGASTVISGNSITTGTINAANVAVTNLNANNITTGTINANTIAVTNLNASNITFGTLNGNNVTVQNLTASAITSGSFSGDRISGGSIVGTTLETATSGRRVKLESSRATFYDEDDNYQGQIYASGTDRGGSVVVTGPSTAYDANFYNGGVALNANAGTYLDVGDNQRAGITLEVPYSSAVSLGGNILLSGPVVIPYSRNPFSDASLTSTNHPFQIGDSNGPNLRIDNNEILAVNNGSAANININIDGGNVQMGEGYNSGSETNLVPGLGIDAANSCVYANGVYARTLTSAYRSVYVSAATSIGGTAYPKNKLGYVSSSKRYKKNIEPLNYTAEQVLGVEPVQYHYNEEDDTSPKHAGFIAEQLDELGLHGYVSYGPDGTPETIQYEFYVSALQTVVRHQAEQISDLQARLLALETRVNSN